MLKDNQEFKYVDVAHTIGMTVELDLKVGIISNLTSHMHIIK